MSSHNIGFYEELTKIIFQLSSNNIISSLAWVENTSRFPPSTFEHAYLSARFDLSCDFKLVFYL